MGIAIGLERQWRQHPAGLRTNALVALGAALFVSLSLLVPDEGSKTRIASYVVSGLGFLGGGVILREGLNVKGLNTAATIWCSGAVGSLCGSDLVGHAALGTFVILFAHLSLRRSPAGSTTARRRRWTSIPCTGCASSARARWRRWSAPSCCATSTRIPP